MVRNYLQNALKRIAWRRRRSRQPLPNSRPNAPDQALEGEHYRQRESLKQRRRDEREDGEDRPSYDPEP
jgi:hypothetical protein